MNPGGWRFNTNGRWSAGAAFALATVVAIFSGCGSKPDTSAKPGGAAAGNAVRESPHAVEASAKTPAKKPATAADLYAQHCAACHGTKGDATGLAAKFLFPKPRDFRSGKFRLVSTSNGIPTPDDIMAVVRRGMPGSSMPPWAHLGDDAVKILVEHVLALRRDGAREIAKAAAAESDDELSEEDLQAIVTGLTTPGGVVAVPDLGKPTPQAWAHGKELYATKGCIQCHGATGKGDGQQQMVDSEGLPTRPRDLSRGIFKGSPDAASMWRRIASGMPGTPLPSSQSLTPPKSAP
jgi:cytochrome c oxidase cbb3-type subunit 2